MDLDDPALIERMARHKANRVRLRQNIELTDQATAGPARTITPAKLDRLATAMQSALKESPTLVRRAYLRMFISRIVVSKDEVRITGPKGRLASVAANDDVKAPPEVLSFVQDWRPVGDSNPCYRRERAMSWASRRTGHPKAGGG